MKELEVECGNGTSGSIFHQRFSGELWLLIRCPSLFMSRTSLIAFKKRNFEPEE